MKILILYAGKTGTTEECVRLLESELHGLDVTVCDADRGENPDPGEYDLAVIGSSVRFGKLRPSVRNYLRTYEETLAGKELALFLCCGLAHEFEYYRERLFPKALLGSAFAVTTFGGSLRRPDAGFWDRLILRKMRESIAQSEIEDGEYTPVMPEIIPANISTLASLIRRKREEHCEE